MKKAVVALACLLCSVAAWAQEKPPGDQGFGFRQDARYDSLLPGHREWLDMVAYIAAPEETRSFLRLTSLRDRDLFIRLFWQQRDPTPGTEANETRSEIERRFRHVNQFFGRGTPRPGWMTAMGRIYMILGEPNSSETFDQVPGILPAQVWYYVGDPKLGLPPYFNVTFYKPYGSGEWEIYDPAANGPAALLVNGDQYGSAGSRQIYKILQQKAPTLAGPAFSMVPGQTAGDAMPSLRNSQIMASIHRSPLRGINPAYADNFLRYRAYVQVDTSVNYIENAHAVAVLKDDLWGFTLVVFSVKPKKLTVGYDPRTGRYDVSFDMTVALKQGENEIYPYQRHYELPMTPEQMAVVQSGGVVIQDAFPVVPGDFHLAVFLQNPVSREFCFFEEAVQVPEAARPRLAPPVLGFKAEKLAGSFFCAYKSGSRRLAVDPDRIFAAGQVPLLWLGADHLDRDLREKGRIAWIIQGLDPRRSAPRKGERRLSDLPGQRHVSALVEAAAAPLAAGFYGLTVQLLAPDGRVVDSRETSFQVSPLSSLAQPSELYSQAVADSPYRMDFIIGQQFRRLGEEDQAVYSLEKSLQANPDFPDARQALLEMLLARGQYERVAREAERLPRSGEAAFAGHFLRGQALFAMRDFAAALDELLAANAIVNADVNLINLIGRSFLELGDGVQAARAFTASLALKPGQPGIAELLSRAKALAGQKQK